jgi:hypothetical protein
VRLTSAVVVVLQMLLASHAWAQAEATIVPSLSVTTTHDDNLFSGTRGESDMLTYLRPSLEGRYESRTTTWQSLVSMDLQRSINHASLNTADARRHAMFEGRVRSTPTVILGMAGRYDRTETAGDLNFDTGILLDRQRATRLQATPSLSYRATVRSTLTAQYDWTNERLSGTPDSTLHVARIGIGRETAPRTTWTTSYLGRMFVDASTKHRSDALLVGWAHELGPGANLSIQAGPRVRSNGGVTSEVAASLIRRTPRSRFLADYWRGETIVLGIVGPVEIHSGSTRFSWAVRRRLELGLNLGVFNSTTIDAREAMVYHGSVSGAWNVQPYIVTVSYGSDLQHGDIRGRRLAGDQIRRGVFLVRLTIAPRLSRIFRPQDDSDQPTTPLKGVIQ